VPIKTLGGVTRRYKNQYLGTSSGKKKKSVRKSGIQAETYMSPVQDLLEKNFIIFARKSMGSGSPTEKLGHNMTKSFPWNKL
jgi:hypothetical protein